MSSIQAFSQTYKKGDKVEIESSGTWYPGNILELKDGQYKIHYDGWESSWDEWVPASRLKAIAPQTKPAPATEEIKKAEEPKQVEQKAPEVPAPVKQESKPAASAATSTQSKEIYYSFAKDGPPVTTYDCQSSPKELWVHIYVPEDALKFDKLVFTIFWKFGGNPKYRDTRLSPWKEYTGALLEGLKKDPWVHVQILNPNNTKELYKKSFGGNGYLVDQSSPQAKGAEPTYKGQTDMYYQQICVSCPIDSYFNCSIAGIYKTGERQEWVYKYSDHSTSGNNEGWWETVDVYDMENAKVFDNYDDKDDDLLIKRK